MATSVTKIVSATGGQVELWLIAGQWFLISSLFRPSPLNIPILLHHFNDATITFKMLLKIVGMLVSEQEV